jgi:predicted SAM-dependent methyltransferase
VDISETNIKEQLRKSGVKKIENAEEYYPFKLTQVVSSVEDMDQFFQKDHFDFIVYTSAIEHMQKEVGYKSLKNCFAILKPGHDMFLSCPNTNDKKDPYDTQYAAHLYEWGINELREAVEEIGFEIIEEYGLVAKVKEFETWLKGSGNKILTRQYQRLKQYIPTAWLMAFIPILYPESSSEILMIIKKPTHCDLNKLL